MPHSCGATKIMQEKIKGRFYKLVSMEDRVSMLLGCIRGYRTLHLSFVLILNSCKKCNSCRFFQLTILQHILDNRPLVVAAKEVAGLNVIQEVGQVLLAVVGVVVVVSP